MVTQEYNVSMIPGETRTVIRASQYDDGNRAFLFHLTEGAAVYAIPTEAVVVFNATKPDRHGVSYSSADTDPLVSFSGSDVTVITTEQMTAVAGQTVCELRISLSGTVIGSANMILEVEKSALDDGTDISETEIPGIIALAREQEANAAASAESAATDAATASTAASTATSAAAAASTSETNAAADASAASASALNAAASESNAADSATAAAGSASAAAVSASNAAGSASAAAVSANSADNSADRASGSASSAATSAGNASTSATSAASSASQAAASETAAAGSATAAAGSASAAASSESNAAASETAAAASETNAAASETAAAGSAASASASQAAAAGSASAAAVSESNSEAWAVGQRGGVDVGSTDDTWHNNSKHYAEVAREIAEEMAEFGVASFNRRTGAVTPQSGDYTASQITRGKSTVDADLTAAEARLEVYKDLTIGTDGTLTAVSGTAGTMPYNYVLTVPWSGLTAADSVDGGVVSGSYGYSLAIGTAADTLTIYFECDTDPDTGDPIPPTTGDVIRVYKVKGVSA